VGMTRLPAGLKTFSCPRRFGGTFPRVITSMRVEHPFLSFLSDGGPAGQSGAVSVYIAAAPRSSRGSARPRDGSQCCGGYAPFGVSGPTSRAIPDRTPEQGVWPETLFHAARPVGRRPSHLHWACYCSTVEMCRIRATRMSFGRYCKEFEHQRPNGLGCAAPSFVVFFARALVLLLKGHKVRYNVN